MPYAPPRICARCKKLVPHGQRCPCAPAREPDRRESASKRGYGAQWRRLRDLVLADEPLCRECAKVGRVVPATDVDHIIPHRGDDRLFWDRRNLQPLCKACHSAKTAREDGGFGNRRKTG
nr:HNH endonuclease signature motif containing protein [Pararhodospirillum photometricum]